MRLLSYIILLSVCAPAAADIYRSVDEHGNVVFSDTPSEGAEKIEVEEAQTIESPETQPFRYEQPQSEPPPRYQSVAISSPQDDESIRANSGNITIRMNVSPSLKRGDKLVLIMDGKQVAAGSNTSVSLENVDRGSHSLQARIEGSDGRTWVSSEPVTFHLLRHSVQHPKPPPGPLNPPRGPVN